MGTVNCPACGFRLSGDADTCPECGRLLRQPTQSRLSEPPVVICANPNCQAANPVGERNCQRCGEALPAAPGTMLQGRYRLEKHLKTGGFGAVYLARDTKKQDQVVVIKEMIVPDPAEFKIRLNFFVRESEILRLLNDKHLPTVPRYYGFTHDEEERSAHLVMEYIPGRNLLEIMESGGSQPFAPAQVVEWGKTLCDVLAVMHEQQPPLIHRDVKPDNIMLLEDGRSIKMIDFGTARELRDFKQKTGLASSPGRGSMTRVFSDGYAPPEQIIGDPEPRSDLFALSATLYQLATGKVPRGIDTAADLAEMLRNPAPAVPRWLLELLAANLVAKVERRHPSARAFKEDLERQSMRRRTGVSKCRLVGTSLTPDAQPLPLAGLADQKIVTSAPNGAQASTASAWIGDPVPVKKSVMPASPPAAAPPVAPRPGSVVWQQPAAPPPAAARPGSVVWNQPAPNAAPRPTSVVWDQSNSSGSSRGLIAALLLVLMLGGLAIGYRKGWHTEVSNFVQDMLTPPPPPAVAPTVTGPTAAGIMGTKAVLGGNVTSDGGAPITRRGILYVPTGINPNPVLGATGVIEVGDVTAGTGIFTVSITDLTPGMAYSFVAFASNSAGTSYTSPASTMTTPVMAPTVATPTSRDIAETKATLGGNITSDGGAPITRRGVLYAPTSVNPSPTLGVPGVLGVDDPAAVTGIFTELVNNLKPGTNYAFVAFASNSAGISYSPVANFTTPLDPTPPTFTNTSGMEFRRIDKGTFQMGSLGWEVGRKPDEFRHTVEITKTFYMAKQPVTKKQFRAFVSETGYRTDAETDGQGGVGFNIKLDGKGGVAFIVKKRDLFVKDPVFSWHNPGFLQNDLHPVVNVTWKDANQFCQWLSKKDGKKYRLPTEAEWEYACRAGTTTRWYFGEEEQDLVMCANIADRSLQPIFEILKARTHDWNDRYAFTSPVGSFRPNRWDLYDMHGNVWQWCADRYEADYYRRSPRHDPPGPPTGEERVMRGGSCFSESWECRCARRDKHKPDIRWPDLGFRVVLEAPVFP